MKTLWIVQLKAEGGGRNFNVFVEDEERKSAEMTAEAALRDDGWEDVATLRSGIVSDDKVAAGDDITRDAATAARQFGWAIIRYTGDS